MKKIVLSKKNLTFIAIVAIFVAVSCDKLSILNKGMLVEEVKIPKYYGNGVYYFDCTDQEFGESLSAFLEDGTKEVSTINSTGTYGQDKGYFVVVKTNKTLNNHLISN